MKLKEFGPPEARDRRPFLRSATADQYTEKHMTKRDPGILIELGTNHIFATQFPE